MQDPLKAFRQGNWMRDSLGTMSPLGGSTDAKELMQLPKEMRDIALAANTLIRGNLSKELWPDLAMLNAIAPRHRLTQIFIASVTAGSMAEQGHASKKFLMGITNMLAPGMLVEQTGKPSQFGKKRPKGDNGKVVEDEE